MPQIHDLVVWVKTYEPCIRRYSTFRQKLPAAEEQSLADEIQQIEGVANSTTSTQAYGTVFDIVVSSEDCWLTAGLSILGVFRRIAVEDLYVECRYQVRPNEREFYFFRLPEEMSISERNSLTLL